MSVTRRREKAARRQAEYLRRNHGPLRQCLHCKVWHRDVGHFVPPSLGDSGIWICEPA